MLVTAGTKEKFNTMTASWGGIGWLWNKPVAFVLSDGFLFIRFMICNGEGPELKCRNTTHHGSIEIRSHCLKNCARILR